MKKSGLIVLVVMMLAALFTGCNKQAGVRYEGSLQFTGAEEFSVAYNDIYEMQSVEAVVNNVTSDGEERVNEVEGVLLETLLKEKGLSQKDFSGIRFIAGDGYAMDVPQEIFAEKDIILAYKFDGEVLGDKKMPLRAAIDDVRSMYYVSNLVEIQLTKGSEIVNEANKVVLMETAFLDLPQDSYTYYDSEDTAILAADLFDAFVSDTPDKVYMMANDGYDKIESYDVLESGCIKITGKDAPLFTGEDLPKGMNVKYLMNLKAGENSFVSVQSAMSVLENRTVQGKEGVAFDALINMAGLAGEYYVLTANDGYSVEVSANALAEASVYILEDGACAVKFDEKYPKNTGIKYLLTVEIGSGENSVTGENTAVAEDNETAQADEAAGWTIVFEGLEDGSFDMTSERAQRKLELVELHTERMKNDEVRPEDWKGYKLLDMLSFLHVEDFEKLTIVASDGYEVELLKEAVDDETILAVEKNGQALTDEDNLVQLVQNTEFATTWVKGVAKIVVN